MLLKRHEVFSEVARANGKVPTGVDRQNFVNDQKGNYVFTGSWIFFLPDGSHIQNAGRIQTTDDGQILSEHRIRSLKADWPSSSAHRWARSLSQN